MKDKTDPVVTGGVLRVGGSGVAAAAVDRLPRLGRRSSTSPSSAPQALADRSGLTALLIGGVDRRRPGRAQKAMGHRG